MSVSDFGKDQESQRLLRGSSRSRSRDSTDFGEDKPKKGEYWLRTTFIALLYMTMVASVAVALAIKLDIFVALGAVLGCVVFLPLSAPALWGCAYNNFKSWRKTLRSAVFWAIFFGGFGTVAGAYFFREYRSIDNGVLVDSADSTANPPANFGAAKRFTDAVPQPQLGGRTLAYGFWPVCVAPIAVSSAQDSVSYWAVGSGRCCTKTDMPCANWNTATGGTLLEYQEFFPNLDDAALDATARGVEKVSESAVYVTYGDVDAHKANLMYRTKLCMGGSMAFAFIIVLFITMRGKY